MRKQCKACPWKKSTNPYDIPGQYCAIKHEGLRNTIAEPGELTLDPKLHLMACHEFPPGKEQVCVGWFHNQYHQGNNIALRLAVMTNRLKMPDYELDGEQHETFEDTLPRKEHGPKKLRSRTASPGQSRRRDRRKM